MVEQCEALQLLSIFTWQGAKRGASRWVGLCKGKKETIDQNLVQQCFAIDFHGIFQSDCNRCCVYNFKGVQNLDGFRAFATAVVVVVAAAAAAAAVRSAS